MTEQKPTFTRASEISGYQSFFAGRSRDTNPYDDEAMRREWFDGYDHAALTSEIHKLPDEELVDGYMKAADANNQRSMDAYQREARRRGYAL